MNFEDEVDYDGEDQKFALKDGKQFTIADFLIWFQSSIVRSERECREAYCRRIDVEMITEFPGVDGNAEGNAGLPADPEVDPSSRGHGDIYVYNGIPWLVC